MTAPDTTIEAEAPVALQRQCGRCRAFFPAAADLGARTAAEWWACDPCRVALFPSKVAAS